MKIEAKSDGVTWREWQSMTVSKSLSTVQHSFQMKTSDMDGLGFNGWNLLGGSKIEVFFDDVKAFGGYVQNYKESATATTHDITIAGESDAIDLVQCGHEGKYFWKGVTAEEIIEEVCEPFGVTLAIDKTLLPIPKEGFRVAVDASPFDIIKRLSDKNGILIFTDDDGFIRLSQDVPQFKYTTLTTGDWIKISKEHEVATTFSKVIVKSQQKSHKKGKFKEEQQKEVVLENPDLTRYRPKIFISDGNKESEEKYSKYVERRINGDGKRVSLTLKSVFDKNGELWGIGQRLWLKEPHLDIDQELIISDLRFSLSESSGIETTMTLQVPETFSITPSSRTRARRSNDFFTDLIEGFQ